MAVWLLVMLALPLLAAGAGAVIGDAPASGWLSAIAAAGSLAAAIVVVFAYHVVQGRHALGSVFFLDGLSGVFLIAVALVYAVVALYSAGYLLPHIGHVRLRRWYCPLLNLFGLALLATVAIAPGLPFAIGFLLLLDLLPAVVFYGVFARLIAARAKTTSIEDMAVLRG